ncbi:hypothetical protein V1291_000072 [Nitrobacteraceae bacterium AZCC 1564]
MTDDKPSPGQPTGWQPQTELEHFMQCPVRGEWFDVRDLEKVLEHWHEGPSVEGRHELSRPRSDR